MVSEDKKTAVENAIKQTKPTLVEFYTAGEAHSDKTLPVVTELSAKVGDKANIIAVDTAANDELVKKYHIHSVPTWIIFRDGQEAWRTGGCLPLSELEDMVNRFI